MPPPKKPNLYSVDPDETSPKPAPAKTILQAAIDGSRLEELQAMRRRIARAMDDPNTPARDLAALSRRQLEIGREVESIEITEDEDQSVIASTDDEDWDESAI